MFNDSIEIQSAKYRPLKKVQRMTWLFNKMQTDKKEKFKRKIKRKPIYEKRLETHQTIVNFILIDNWNHVNPK